MSVARQAHTATLLKSGKVLVAGGRDNTGVHASCELYDPDHDTWSMTGPMSSPRNRHTATRVTMNDTDVVFVLGGSWTTNYDQVPGIEYYNATSGVWRTIVDPMRQGRFSHTTTLLLDGRLLSAGGQTNTTRLASAEIFDPTALTSQVVGSLKVARYGHIAAIIAISGNVLVTGGMTSPGNVYLASCELFNINSHNWSLVANLSNALSFVPMVPLMPASSSILITGGRATNISTSLVQLFNPLTNTVSSSSSMNVGRYSHTSTLMYFQATAFVMVIGGYDTSQTGINAVQLYVPTNSTWLNISNLNTGRGRHTTTLLVGSSPSVLVTGGVANASGTLLRSAERLTFT